MPQPQHLDPSPFAADRGPVGILLLHGFTGSVAETRPMGEYMAARGLTVRCPLLPGHGTSPHDLTRIRWHEWTAVAEEGLQNMQKRCQTVFVGGLSAGSLLTLWLGAHHPSLAGLIPMAPAIWVNNKFMPLTLGLRHVMKFYPSEKPGDDDLVDPAALDRTWSYDQIPLWGAAEVYLLQRQVRRMLSHIRQPILIFQGKRDNQVPMKAAQAVYDRVQSVDKGLVKLESSGHNLLADGERESVWAQSFRWIRQHSPDNFEQ